MQYVMNTEQFLKGNFWCDLKQFSQISAILLGTYLLVRLNSWEKLLTVHFPFKVLHNIHAPCDFKFSFLDSSTLRKELNYISIPLVKGLNL